MQDLECTCGSSYRSPGDYKLAIKMGWTVDYTHAFLDLWEECLDEVLDRKDKETGFNQVLNELKEEYERTVKGSSDSEGG